MTMASTKSTTSKDEKLPTSLYELFVNLIFSNEVVLFLLEVRINKLPKISYSSRLFFV